MMADTGRALTLTADILLGAKKYPWKTARYLSGALRRKGCAIGAKTLEDALMRHARDPDRSIRYSFYPARKTLDLLWGHNANVNDAKDLPDPHLTRRYGQFTRCAVGDEAPWLFLSHSFHDIETVAALRDLLMARGYGAWLAEAEMEPGDLITLSVQKGMRVCDELVVYLSRNALGSRWVLKEALVGIQRWKLPPTVVVDGRDPLLVALAQEWLESEWSATLSERIGALVNDPVKDPKATEIPGLVHAALDPVPREARVAVVYPRPADSDHSVDQPPFKSLQEAFPRQTENEPIPPPGRDGPRCGARRRR